MLKKPVLRFAGFYYKNLILGVCFCRLDVEPRSTERGQLLDQGPRTGLAVGSRVVRVPAVGPRRLLKLRQLELRGRHRQRPKGGQKVQHCQTGVSTIKRSFWLCFTYFLKGTLSMVHGPSRNVR